MNTRDRITLGGFAALAALTVALFAWLRADIAAVYVWRQPAHP